MTTTIQIDDETKKRLFRIKLKLEEEKGSAVTYNEIIKFLINHQSNDKIKKENLSEFRKLKGILPKSALSVYLSEKKQERVREEKRVPLIQKNNEL